MVNERYFSFLRNLVRITHEEPFDYDKYLELLKVIGDSYGVAKGITQF